MKQIGEEDTTMGRDKSKNERMKYTRQGKKEEKKEKEIGIARRCFTHSMYKTDR